jgi:cell division protein FtsN
MAMKESPETDSTSPDTVAMAMEESPEIPAGAELPEQNYHVIVGSFKSQQKAESFTVKLKDLGYEPEILGSDIDYFRIALYSTAQKQDAKDLLAELRAEHGMERAWVLTASR